MCPKDWIKNGRTCYRFVDTKNEQFSGAAKQCEEMNSKLLRIDDVKEDSFVKRYAKKKFPDVKSTYDISMVEHVLLLYLERLKRRTEYIQKIMSKKRLKVDGDYDNDDDDGNGGGGGYGGGGSGHGDDVFDENFKTRIKYLRSSNIPSGNTSTTPKQLTFILYSLTAWRTGGRLVNGTFVWYNGPNSKTTKMVYTKWQKGHPASYSSLALVYNRQKDRVRWQGVWLGSATQLPDHAYPFICERRARRKYLNKERAR